MNVEVISFPIFFMNNRPVAILGAGLMGTAIAAAHLKAGISVVLYDPVPLAREQAPRRIVDECSLQQANTDSLRLLSLKADLEEVAQSSFIIETIPEKLKLKQKLYRNLAKFLPDNALLLSNTSTIAIAALAEATPDPRNFCGFHFFHPVRERSLLEIIPGRSTSSETLEHARQLALAIGKQPITVGDGPGFLVNRLLNPYLSEALVLLEEGVPLLQIERAATNFGMQMGPFRIMDEIGLDVTLHGGWVLHKAFPERVLASPILLEMVRRGLLGRKCGRGFSLYDSTASWNGTGSVNKELHDIYNATPISVPDEEIVDRLFLGMLLEACRCLEDDIVPGFAEVDLAVVHGLGFPAARGGLSSWAQQMDQEVLQEKLILLEKRFGPRFRPAGPFFTLSSES